MPMLEEYAARRISPPLPDLLGDRYLFDHLPLGAYVCDAVGLIVRYNKAAVEVWGRSPQLKTPESRYCGAHRLFDAVGRDVPPERCPMAVALATGQGCREQSIIIEQPGGRRLRVLMDIDVIKGADGEVAGAIAIFRHSPRPEADLSVPNERNSDLEQILHALPAAIYATDAAGAITFYNEAAARLWGIRPEIGQSKFCGSWKLYWPDGSSLPHSECPMAVALKEARAIYGMEAVAERPDGTRVPFLAYPTPLVDSAGKLTGAVNMLVDISDRGRAEVAMQRLAAIVESSDDAILAKDLNGIITNWNRGAERLFGYTEQEAIGRPVTILIPDDRQDEEPDILARIRRGERIDHYETVRRRKNGSLVEISLTVSPIVDQRGKVIGASKIARDITERKHAEEQRDLLLREMNHRIKNLFTLSSGLVNLSARNASSVEELATDVQERFAALARAHSLTLPSSPEHEAAKRSTTTLHMLIRGVTLPYLGTADAAKAHMAIIGPDAPVSGSAITSFALIFHEFTANAAKYGALAQAAGSIRIECAEVGDQFVLNWRESQFGGAKEGHEGFGSVLARTTITRSLGGSFVREFSPDGLVIKVSFPRSALSG